MITWNVQSVIMRSNKEIVHFGLHSQAEDALSRDCRDRSGRSPPASPDALSGRINLAVRAVDLMAARNDVLVSVQSGPFRQDIARSCVERTVVNPGK
jgi:hypothetical protein